MSEEENIPEKTLGISLSIAPKESSPSTEKDLWGDSAPVTPEKERVEEEAVVTETAVSQEEVPAKEELIVEEEIIEEETVVLSKKEEWFILVEDYLSSEKITVEQAENYFLRIGTEDPEKVLKELQNI